MILTKLLLQYNCVHIYVIRIVIFFPEKLFAKLWKGLALVSSLLCPSNIIEIIIHCSCILQYSYACPLIGVMIVGGDL